jgi:hypothetical protein
VIKVTQWKMVADGKPNEWAGIVGLTRYFLRDWDFLRDWATSVLQLFATMEEANAA